jgi:prepilin-type N-terminal cleavage/methylation domain-containing protein
MRPIMQNPITGQTRAVRRARCAAFTLIELLVVIAIIGLLATIGLPALKGFGKGTGMAGAERQLLQDLDLARQWAISGRATVYMVFAPPNILNRLAQGSTSPSIMKQLTNLVSGQYSAYALLSMRTVGDQPGQGTPRYLSEWKRLPQGILIPTNKFAPLNLDPPMVPYPDEYRRGFATNAFPFPSTTKPMSFWTLPYIAFNPQGQVISEAFKGKLHDALIPLAEGSIFFRGGNGGYLAVPDMVMKPAYNYTNHWIRVNWLTGRASVDQATRPRF